MKITFITIFPNYIEELVKHSIIKRSIDKGLIEIETINPRDFSKDNQIDDTVYGGGEGMLLMIEPIVKAIRHAKTNESKVYLMGPRGPRFNQEIAKELSQEKHIILISGHYEGVDSRIKHYIDGEISIGDFILTGGEMPSMLVADAIIRLVPGVIKEGSHQNESFEDNLLEHDHFTRPVDFEGHQVPEELLSGNHKVIDEWRKTNSRKRTIEVLLEEKKGK